MKHSIRKDGLPGTFDPYVTGTLDAYDLIFQNVRLTTLTGMPHNMYTA